MLEVGLTIRQSPNAGKAWNACSSLLTLHTGAVEKHGTAPKVDIVRRWEATLKIHKMIKAMEQA